MYTLVAEIGEQFLESWKLNKLFKTTVLVKSFAHLTLTLLGLFREIACIGPTCSSLKLLNAWLWRKPHVATTYGYEDICEKPLRKISERTVVPLI